MQFCTPHLKEHCTPPVKYPCPEKKGLENNSTFARLHPQARQTLSLQYFASHTMVPSVQSFGSTDTSFAVRCIPVFRNHTALRHTLFHEIWHCL